MNNDIVYRKSLQHMSLISSKVPSPSDSGEQQRRLQARGGYTEPQARDRIDCQMPLHLKVERADYVIENTGSRCYTQ